MIVSHVKLIATIPIDVAQRVIESWARNMKDEAPDMYAKMLSRIPDMKRFVERLGQPSHDGYAPFVNPTFVSKGGQGYDDIEAGQASNIKRSYDKYRAKLDYMFATVDGIPAKRFKDMVEQMKGVYGLGAIARTLPFTGTKIEGRSCAPLAAMWLVNDLTVLDQLRSADKVLEGGPILVTAPNEVPSFKVALNQRLIQAGASIVKRNFDAAAFAEHNDRTNNLVQHFLNPGLGLNPFATGGPSHVDYILEHDQLFLDIQVDRV